VAGILKDQSECSGNGFEMKKYGRAASAEIPTHIAKISQDDLIARTVRLLTALSIEESLPVINNEPRY